MRIRRHRSNPKQDSSSDFSKCHECGKILPKSELFNSNYCKECYNTIKLAEDLSLERCENCRDFFDPSQSSDPHHCPNCIKKMRRCRNCHKKFIPNGKILLCPVCYSNIVKTCRICKEDFIPKSRSHNLCPKCQKKIEYRKKTKVSKKKVEKKVESKDRTVEILIKALDDPKSRDFATKALTELEKEHINKIIQSLKGESEKKRSLLVKILVDKAEYSVDYLIKALADEDYQIRKDCVKALGLIGDKRAVEPLIETLEDLDSAVRINSAKALGLIGDKRAVEPLIETLEDYDYFLSRKSAKALGLIGDKRAIDPLIESARSNNNLNVRTASISALRNFRDDRIISCLIEFLDDNNPKVVISCLKSLTEIDDEIGLIHLTKNVFNTKKQVADFSTDLIISIKGEEYLKQITPEEKTKSETLSKEEFLELINNLSNSDHNVRIKSAQILGSKKDPRSANYLVNLLDDDNKEVRLEVIKSLGNLKNLDTLKSLIKTLKDEDTIIMVAASEAIVNFGTEAISTIAKCLEKDDEDLKYHLVDILGDINNEESEKLLIQSLEELDIDVKIKTIESIEKIGTDKSINPLITTLNDDDKKIRRISSNALIKICQEKDLELLEDILKKEYQGKNDSLETLIQEIKAKTKKIKSQDKSESKFEKVISTSDTNNKENYKKLDKTPSRDISETSSNEDIEDEEDIGDDLFEILDEITKK